MDKESYGRSFDRPAIEVKSRHEQALQHAIQTRAFEIDLYWRRATYFWTLIAAAIAGYAVAQTIDSPDERTFLSVAIGSLGFVFSFAWACVNRGSKRWQQNWEAHVDALEDEQIGPLFKTVFSTSYENRWHIKNLLTGSADFSVSRVNQLVSQFVVLMWLPMIWRSLPTFSRDAPIDWPLASVVVAALLTCVLILLYGRTGSAGNERRTAKVRDETFQ